jgi:hypothetical protein
MHDFVHSVRFTLYDLFKKTSTPTLGLHDLFCCELYFTYEVPHKVLCVPLSSFLVPDMTFI